MAQMNDEFLRDAAGVEIVRPVGKRTITHAVHDVDGTHSLIRDWPPAMSLSIHWAMTSGLEEDFDSPDNLAMLIERVGREPLPETDEFCVESAGLSALTQMEYGIRRAIELGNFPADLLPGLGGEAGKVCARIAKLIWNGQERFDDIEEPQELLKFIAERGGRLFRLYEKVLNGACRDKNTAIAFKDPERFRVPGSLEFMGLLQQCGIVNYFVTGAVVYEEGGMAEEIRAVGLEAGEGQLVRELRGSSWDRKMPKIEVISELFEAEGICPESALVLGDGRTEIAAGASMGCVTMSRLPQEATRQRQLHRELGTNYIFEDWTSPGLKEMFRA
jgi:hypothetical protein